MRPGDLPYANPKGVDGAADGRQDGQGEQGARDPWAGRGGIRHQSRNPYGEPDEPGKASCPEQEVQKSKPVRSEFVEEADGKTG